MNVGLARMGLNCDWSPRIPLYSFTRPLLPIHLSAGPASAKEKLEYLQEPTPVRFMFIVLLSWPSRWGRCCARCV